MKWLETRGLKKPLLLDQLPTVPDSECKKGYTYTHDEDGFVGDDDYDFERDEDEVIDDAMLMEMAFDAT